MTAKTSSALNTQADDNVTSNSNKENTGTRVRTLLKDMIDSFVNATDSIASVANYRAKTTGKVIDTDGAWGGMAEVTLTDAATVALDLSTGFDFTVTLGGNRTLGNATNVQVGQRGRIRVVQDGTGSRTLSFSSNYEFAGGSAPTLTTTASAQDILYYDCISATRILVLNVLDIS